MKTNSIIEPVGGKTMNNGKISVAMIEPVGGHGGMDYYDFGLCDGLLKAGCSVSLYTCDKTKQPAIPGLSFHPFFCGIYGNNASWVRALRYLVAILRTMARAAAVGERICHFHFFHGGIIDVFSVLLAKLFLRKVIITVHDVESFGGSMLPAGIVGAIYGLADCLIVHNQVCRAEVMSVLRVSPGKIQIVPHGNYLHMIGGAFGKAEAQRSLGIDAEKKIILFFGQIKEVKGLEVLLKAMPSVVDEQSDAILLIAGRPWRSDFMAYEAMMDRIGIRDHCISHIRYIPDEAVPLYYSACDLVVLPYRRIYQSGVVLMAMSYGKAVLVSDLPGMTEIVTHGENGFVFCEGSDQDLASKINEALGDSQRCEQTARRGLEYVRNNHDWGQIGRMTASVYGSIA